MSIGPAYSGLGQILSRGAEISVARMVSQGIEESIIRETILSRFGSLRGEVEQALLDLSSSMAQAGAIISALDPFAEIPAELIPANQFLFGDDPRGSRVILGVLVNAGDKKERREVQQIWPDIPSLQDVMAAASDEYERRAKLYPERFAGLSDQQIIEAVNTIAWIEKRF